VFHVMFTGTVFYKCEYAVVHGSQQVISLVEARVQW